MCKTRWVEHHFAIYSYQYFVVWNALLAVHVQNGIEKPDQTQSFLLSMSQFSFIITLVATQNVYDGLEC